jgi:death-on-curing protein
MEGTGEALEFEPFGIEDVIEINRRMIEEFGGSFSAADCNFHNEGSLAACFAAIAGPIFGYDLYPTLEAKASALACAIIQSHVFHDGNKRTGLQTAIFFLEINGYDVGMNEATHQEFIDVTFKLAKKEMNRDEFTEWLKDRMKPTP